MLTRLEIRNFAIIDKLEVDWQDRMTVITGETGAGKSIAIDALSLALGERVDSSQIAQGADQAEVVADFELDADSAAMQWLEDNDLDEEGACILRRVINRSGRARCFINGRSVPLSSLKQLGERLVDIHGQHAQQSLLRKREQMALLDRYGQHQALLNKVAAAARHLKAIEQKRTELKQAAQERRARIELLTYQVEELEQANLSPQLVNELEQRHREAATSGERAVLAQQMLSALENDEGSGILDRLSHLHASQEHLQQLDPGAERFNESLLQAQEILHDYLNDLRHYLDHIEHDPAILAELDAQLATLHDLARKHQVTLAQLPEKYTELQQELADLNASEEATDKIDQDYANAQQAYTEAAAALSTARLKTAKQLGEKVTALMQDLAMQGGQFSIVVQSNAQVSEHGSDDIQYLVSANPGQPLQPLAKVASGGELSRISLAIAVVTAEQQLVPSIIFDEVDVGIGGGTAEVVGRLLQQLARQRQVICVTHQPQVAACGHHHFSAIKSKTATKTRTQLVLLDDDERHKEIARMLGGLEISDTTLAHAKEMLGAVHP